MSAMTETAAREMEGFDERGQAALLAQVAHRLTVSARDAYEMPTDGSERLRRYNEIQHLLTAHVSSLLNDADHRSSLTLFEAIKEIAGQDAIGQKICECVDWALGLTLKQDGRS